MADNKLATHLKRNRFAPTNSFRSTPPYPIRNYDDGYGDDRRAAELLGLKSCKNKLVEALRQALRESDISPEWIEKNPTLVMLQRSLPPKVHTEVKGGEHTLTHFDRIAWYSHQSGGLTDRSQLIGLAHMRHVAIIRNDVQCQPSGAWEGFAVYRMQLLDMWDQQNGDGSLEWALTRRAEAHLEQIGYSALDALDTYDDGFGSVPRHPVPVIVVIEYPFERQELAESAAKVAAALSPRTDERSNHFWAADDDCVRVSNVLLRPISEADEELIEKVTRDGIASLKPPARPKAAPGSKHLLVEVCDKHLVLLRGGASIGHRNYDHEGTELKWRLIVDEGSRLFYVEPLLGSTDEADIDSFLERAWQRKDNLVFEGPPATLEVAKSHLKRWPTLLDYLTRRRVAMVHPKHGLGLGLTIGRCWLEDTRMATGGDGFMKRTELTQWTLEHQLVVAGHGFYFDAEDEARNHKAYQAFGWTAGDHFTGIRVDTRAFVEAVDRSGVESVIRQNWPGREER